MVENIKRINEIQAIFNNVNEYYTIIVHQLDSIIPMIFHCVDYHSVIHNQLSTEYILLLESIDNGIYTDYIAPYSDYAFDRGIDSHYKRLGDNLLHFGLADDVDITIDTLRYSKFFDLSISDEYPLKKTVYKEIKNIIFDKESTSFIQSSDYDTFVRDYLNSWTTLFIKFLKVQYKKLSTFIAESQPDDEYIEYSSNQKKHLDNLKRFYSWYYNFNRPANDSTKFEIYDIPKIYSNLGKCLAESLYKKLYKYMLDFAHHEQSNFYGDYPTIWEQLKADERHGDPPMNEGQLEIGCCKWLNKLQEFEIKLIWVYACDNSNSNISIYDDIECVDFERVIFRVILDELYNEAEKENCNDFYET